MMNKIDSATDYDGGIPRFKLSREKHRISFFKRLGVNFLFCVCFFLLIWSGFIVELNSFIIYTVFFAMVFYVLLELFIYIKSNIAAKNTTVFLFKNRITIDYSGKKSSIFYEDCKNISAAKSKKGIEKINIATNFGHVVKIANFEGMDLLYQLLEEKIRR